MIASSSLVLTGAEPPSPWIVAHGPLLPAGGVVLDLACGSGRNALWLAGRGHRVLAVDRDAGALADLAGVDGIETRCCELEGDRWPLIGLGFTGIVVTRYLYRPRLQDLFAGLAADGVLVYETFMRGNERYGRPSNPDYLLQPGELFELAQSNGLEVLDFVEGFQESPAPAMVQAICARRRQQLDVR